MAEPTHPDAIHHLPLFITAPGETDVFFVVTGLFVLLTVIGLGIFYFKLHALPEQMAHRGQKVQFEIVAVLGLLALFTHNHAFWIAGLLLALVPLPNFGTPLSSIANSLERLAAAAGHREGPPPSKHPSTPAETPAAAAAQHPPTESHEG